MLKTIVWVKNRITDFIILTFIFIVSRIGLRLIGISFDHSPFEWFYQFIDPLLLKTRLVESLLYLHSQPPGFNIFLGVVFILGKTQANTIFGLLYMLIGLITVLTLYSLLRCMEVPRILSVITSSLFILSPPTILYENWLFYTYPVTMLLLIAAFLLFQYLKSKKSIILILFFSTLVLIVLTRTLFHTLWFFAIIVWLVMLHKKRIKQILMCALLPVVLISAVHIKNLVLFRQTNLSSWVGMNIAKMTLSIPLHIVRGHIKRGELSPVAQIEPFGRPEEYDTLAPFDTITSIPVLDMDYKSTGYVNYNHIAYRSVSHQYLQSALFLIPRYPLYYGLSIIKALYAYLQPSSDKAIFVNDNRHRIRFWTLLYEDYLLGSKLRSLWHTTFTNRYGQKRTVHLNFLFFFTPFIFIWGVYVSWKKNVYTFYVSHLTHVFLISTVIYVTVVGNVLEMSENMRFRYLIVPFIYILFSIFFKRFFKKTPTT